jgi:hypothetical protein
MNPPAFDNPFRENRLNTSQNFRPEWDVPELNADVSTWLVREVFRLRGRREADPGQMIPVLLSPPGYGKTHLFGRISHLLGHEVFFVFVPALEERKGPLDHILWHVVESLFRAPQGGYSPIAHALARLCRPAFFTYFDRLPPTLASRHESMRQRLQESSEAVLDIVRQVGALDPFLKLADSLTHILPNHAGVVRALAMGWAPEPWPTAARRWLRGEDLPDEDLATLGLDCDAPTAMDVLRALPALFEYEKPMVICCDQMESVLKSGEANVVNRFTTALMEILQEIPVQLVMSCLQDLWDDILKDAFGGFRMRVRQPPFELAKINGDQAVRLVRGRIKTWPGANSDWGESWPLDEASIVQFIRERRPTPRGLIQECAAEMDGWAQDGKDGWVKLKNQKSDIGPDLDVLFLQEWNRELETIRRDPARSAEEQPEERIYDGIFEALTLANVARRELGGIRIREVQDRALAYHPPVRRYGAQVMVTVGRESAAVVVAITKLDSSQRLRFFFDALANAFADPVSGAVLIHPKRELNLGPATRDAFAEAQRRGKVRLFPLEDNPLTFAALECLVTLLKRAGSRELQLGGLTLSAEDCRDLVLKTGVIDQLDLFKTLGHWGRTTEPVRIKQPVMATVAVAPQGPPVVAPPQPPPTVAKAESEARAPEPDESLDRWAEGKLAEVEKKLKLWGLPVEPDGHEIGPAFARLKVRPVGAKTTFKSVSNKAVDLRIHLGLDVVPMIGSQAGYISIDIQRPSRQDVPLAGIQAGPPEGKDGDPVFPAGKDVAGTTHWLNLADPADCHLLVAGTTGSGKSEFLRAMVAALAARLPHERLQFVIIDPKRVTFSFGGGVSPYLRSPVAHDLAEALPLVQSCLQETGRRYTLLEQHKQTNVSALPPTLMPRIVIVIDEFANLMEDKETKKAMTALLKQIGAMARAAGIHLVLATQRPDKDVVTPLLRDNLPGRIALRVAAKASSELILGSPDAVNLLGRGDLLWKQGGGLLRLQSPFVTQAELEARLKIR